jgi:hypothetical protein
LEDDEGGRGIDNISNPSVPSTSQAKYVFRRGNVLKKPLWCGGRGESEINHRG